MSEPSTAPLKIVFAGTPDFAAKHLESLITSQHQVVAVYTQPDRPAGRGKKLQASPVKQAAEQANIPVYQPASLKQEEAQQALAALEFDIMVVVAYGLILPKTVLDIPRLGCVNVHGSILPRWRGAAPIQRSIWAGDAKTGVTIMQMDEGLDTGDMLLIKELAIEDTDTSASLYQKLAQLGPTALVEAMDNYQRLQATPQNDAEANYAHKLEKAEGLIDWQQSAEQLARNIRAFNPWPGTWFAWAEQNIKVWEAQDTQTAEPVAPGTITSVDKNGLCVQTGSNILRITTLQIPGKKQQSFSDILNARPDWFVVGQNLAEKS